MNLLMSTGFALTQSSGRISPVWLALILAALVIFILWLVLRWMSKSNAASRVKNVPTAEKQPAIPTVKETPAPEPAVPAPAAPDDLQIIEGIGPKIAGVLCAQGITTFAQLAALKPEKISELLLAGGIKLADPRTWPEQARLAAAGDLSALKDMQDHLKAGRAV